MTGEVKVQQLNPTIPGTRGTSKVKPPKRKMSQLEWDCGITQEQYEQFHASQRDRVRARFLGVKT